MEDLSTIETTALVDMLVKQTTEFLKLNEETGNDAEYAKCILTIRALQREIEKRNQQSIKASNTTGSSIAY
ncbi:hypothetical protein CAP36_14150 [Chitinophagaceae bacterium IBVUCB2]|nr:hypothetical protein CAP36_14150 [Chitinophagaceae bacterium IBVUCB2]